MFPDITCDDIFRIESRRLWLRWLRATDAPAIAAFASLAVVAHMTASIPHPYPAGEADRFVLTARAATAAGHALILGMTLKNKARTLIGLVSAQIDPAVPHEVEIGYVTTPSQTGRGYATEAVRALIDTVFNLTEARTITASSRTINPASRRILEKCGFAFVASELRDLPARGGRHPCDVFQLARHSWAGRQGERRLPPMRHQVRDTHSMQSGDMQDQ